ncbi:MAG: alpha/beta hydrolase [Bacilli bacterium]|nr:alpha/beta hydrolase [Bacilli bacterium]
MKIKDVNINYVTYGKENGKNIVLLHGWGQNIEMMDPIGRRLQDDFRITIIDLPGFGKSDMPSYGWTLYDYYDAVDELLTKLKISNPIMIGHSFGGRISIIYASMKQVDKLILLASPFRRMLPKKPFKEKILKFLKKIPLINLLEEPAKRLIGSEDYRNANPIKREILVNTVNADLSNNVDNIKCSTIIIWGSNDELVPISEANYLKEHIKDSGLIIYDGCTHYAYLERIDQTINILNEFLKKDKS